MEKRPNAEQLEDRLKAAAPALARTLADDLARWFAMALGYDYDRLLPEWDQGHHLSQQACRTKAGEIMHILARANLLRPDNRGDSSAGKLSKGPGGDVQLVAPLPAPSLDIKAALGAPELHRRIVAGRYDGAEPAECIREVRDWLKSPILHAAVQRLIAAETERCRQCAIDQQTDHPQGDWNDACLHIAAAIRKGERT